jgi:putative transposase
LSMEQDKPARKAIRLKAYDYAQNGAYFVTICTQGRRNILWSVGASFGRPNETPLSSAGILVGNEIKQLSGIYENVSVGHYVVMPNHIHMIVLIGNDGGHPQDAPTLSRIVQQFKGAVSKKAGFPVWQKSFYDHIIRSEQEYAEVWQYIDTNPLKMQEDPYTTQTP